MCLLKPQLLRLLIKPNHARRLVVPFVRREHLATSILVGQMTLRVRNLTHLKLLHEHERHDSKRCREYDLDDPEQETSGHD
jgi:hypothetical protein